MPCKSIFLIAVLFFGHVAFGHAAGINPKKLKPAAVPTRFYLDTAYTYTVMFKGVPLTYTVVPGTYTAELAGEGGQFLRCQAQCVEVNTLVPGRRPITEHVEGGLLLTDQGTKIYFYRNYRGQTDFGAGAIVNAIIRAGDGDILFPRKQSFDKSLGDRIRQVDTTP